MDKEKGDYLAILRKYLIILHLGYGGGPHHIELVEEMYQDLKIAHSKMSPEDQVNLGLPGYPYVHNAEAVKDVISRTHIKK